MKIEDITKERVVAVIKSAGKFEKDGKTFEYNNIKVLTVINKNGVDVCSEEYKFKHDDIMDMYGCTSWSELSDRLSNKIVADARYNKFGTCTELIIEEV